MENNKLVLLSNYKKARGTTFIDPNDYNNWILDQKESLKCLKKILQQHFIPYTTKKTIEIGKTMDSTIVNDNDDSIILTPYTDSFNIEDKRNILGGNLYFLDNTLCYGLNKTTEESMNMLGEANYILTHNPSHIKTLNNWELIPYYNKILVLGMHGNKKDKDAINKMNIMFEMKKRFDLDRLHLEGDIINSDEYYACMMIVKKKLLNYHNYTNSLFRQ